jgi:two-component system chemotaxis response regulator CheB
VRLTEDPPRHGVRPSVDVTLASVAETFGGHATVAILTGMGRDGAEGAAQLETKGATVVVQDEASCVVFGMPRVARERTSHAIEADIDDVAAHISQLVAAAA